MVLLKKMVFALCSFSSGVVISGAIFAFITVIGIVPRLAGKTKTYSYIKVYETALMIGGVAGACAELFNLSVSLNNIFVIILSLTMGIFFGCLAASLAEVLNVIPVLVRRIRINQGLFYIVCALAVGKAAGSLLYFFVSGFYKPD